jgi:predicted TIM-barrel fold metal-dependent hydrolase
VIDPFHVLARKPGASIEAALSAALAELDRFGVGRAGVCLDREPELARAALAAFPARFFARCEADPLRGLGELRRLESLAREHGLRAVTLSPARLFLPLDDARCYPLFAKCVELDVALCPSVGVPPERVPFSPQKVERLDPVACHFPELRLVMRGGAEPWQDLAVLLMRRHPNLAFATGGFAPSELPAGLRAFASADGAHQVLFASEPPAGESAERFYKALPELDLARRVWPLFARDNAARILKLS